MNYFLSLPEGIQDDVFSYISIMEHLEICTVSRKFNAMITNTNTPQMEGARDTITGWWVQENKYDHYHSLPITEYLEIFEEELLLVRNTDKSNYWRITRLFYVNLSNKVSWNQVATYMEREYNLEVLGRTNNLHERLCKVKRHLTDDFDYCLNKGESIFEHLTEYYQFLDENNMFLGQSSLTLPNWTDSIKYEHDNRCPFNTGLFNSLRASCDYFGASS
jgi:hypothetical protein